MILPNEEEEENEEENEEEAAATVTIDMESEWFHQLVADWRNHQAISIRTVVWDERNRHERCILEV